LLQTEQGLQGTGDESRFSVQKQEGHHSDQWWKDDGQYSGGGEEGPPGKFIPVEDKGQRDTDQAAEEHAQNRNVQAVPEGLQIGQRLRREKLPVVLQGKASLHRQAFHQRAEGGVEDVGEEDGQDRD